MTGSSQASGLSQLSIKTRIETTKGSFSPFAWRSVWVSYPLKQGLKHRPVLPGRVAFASLSQLSIKTRIETYREHFRFWKRSTSLSQLSIKTRIETISQHRDCHPDWGLSQLSIKTRIETPSLTERVFCISIVWVSYPLKQGLKLAVLICRSNPSVFESAIH